MIKEVKYLGLQTNPSDYECSDGQLALSVGTVLEDGSLHGILPPKEIFSLAENERVVFVHKTSSFKYYIIFNEKTNEVSYTDGNAESQPFKHSLHTFTTSSITGFNAIGNTLIVLANDGMHYFLWKSLEEGYIYLGTHIPELPISFGLQGELIRDDSFTIEFDQISIRKGDVWLDFTDSNKTRITEQVLAKVNKFIAENSTNAGKFLYPFFVRYAYRLYDGSLTMHSAPILMLCSSDLAPQCFVSSIKSVDDIRYFDTADLFLAGMFHQLDYAVINAQALQELKQWSDIVRSVDVFVSKPIYTYDQSGECTKFVDTDFSDCYSICKHINQSEDAKVKFPARYQKSSITELYANTYYTEESEPSYPTWRLMLPVREGDSIKGDITDNQLFYFLKSINLDDLKTDRTIIPVSKDYLQSLVEREVMTDDYDSHDLLIPQYTYIYNSRFNIANLKKLIFSGYNSGSMMQFTDGCVHNYTDEEPTYKDRKVTVSVYFHIKEDGKIFITKGDDFAFGIDTPYLWIFHPNPNAFKVTLVINDSGFAHVYEANLEPHPTLNGAYFFSGWDGINVLGNEVTSIPELSSVRVVNVPNKIYTSEVNDPFYFPVTGINTVGTGEILGICSAAKALSPGQYGQYPLYAFTTEGIWAMGVSNTGTYSDIKTVTEDVCNNPKSITQIDTSVLFTTNRGIMVISGSETACLSDEINGSGYFEVTNLPMFSSLMDAYNQLAGEGNEIQAENVTLNNFNDYLKDCQMVYDYTNQRIYVYNDQESYAYVYSLKTKTWGMVKSNIVSHVRAYPEALVMLSNNVLADLSASDQEKNTVLIVTRPMKFGAPDVLKTLDTVIQRGMLKPGSISQVLYASRDLFNWYPIYSAKGSAMRLFRGTPYKYFRLSIVGEWGRDECLYGLTAQFTPRFTNRPR